MLQYTLAANETERECFLASNPSLRCAWASFYMLKGSPTGGNADKGKNGKGNCGWYSYLYSVSYLTLTAGDKGIECPSASPKQCKKGTVRGATACHDGSLVSAACHLAPLAAQTLATRAWKGPRATRWWMCWSAGTEW